jgi:hypothetical protein
MIYSKNQRFFEILYPLIIYSKNQRFIEIRFPNIISEILSIN